MYSLHNSVYAKSINNPLSGVCLLIPPSGWLWVIEVLLTVLVLSQTTSYWSPIITTSFIHHYYVSILNPFIKPQDATWVLGDLLWMEKLLHQLEAIGIWWDLAHLPSGAGFLSSLSQLIITLHRQSHQSFAMASISAACASACARSCHFSCKRNIQVVCIKIDPPNMLNIMLRYLNVDCYKYQDTILEKNVCLANSPWTNNLTLNPKLVSLKVHRVEGSYCT